MGIMKLDREDKVTIALVASCWSVYGAIQAVSSISF